MPDYISREAALTVMERLRDKCGNDEMAFALNWASGLLRNVPAADVVEVRHGRWIDRPSKRGYGMATYCSYCEQHSGIGGIESNRHRAYCPNCGAKMDGGQDDGD